MKYQILEILKEKELNAIQLKEELDKRSTDDLNIVDISMDSLRVILSRLLKEGKIKVVRNDCREYTYKYNDNQVITKIVKTEEFKEVFTEMYLFFKDIMQNNNIISDKVKWNELWSKRNKTLIYQKAESLNIM